MEHRYVAMRLSVDGFPTSTVCRNRELEPSHGFEDKQVVVFNSAGCSRKSCLGHDVLVADMVKPMNIEDFVLTIHMESFKATHVVCQ